MSDWDDPDYRRHIAEAMAGLVGKAGGHRRAREVSLQPDPPKVPTKKRIWARCFDALCVWRKPK